MRPSTYSHSEPATAHARRAPPLSWRDRFGAAMLKRVLAGIWAGRILIDLPGGGRLEHVGTAPGPEARLCLTRWRAMRRMATGGDMGLAEGYMAGDWTSPDVTALIALAAANGATIEEKLAGLAPLRLLNKLRHATRRNSRSGSRRNISFHYDLGNDFYRLWLDPSLTYSSALFSRQDETLEEAQAAKLARICDLLELKGGEQVLEIGCGWGALAAALAGRGANVTGVTLSQEQLAHGQTVVAGLRTGSVDLRLQDYREVTGQFDRIVSVEMMEAVGEAYWPVYFETLRERLRPGGVAVLQVITIAEDRFARYRAKPDFIQRYVFPGGMLPTPSIIAEGAAGAGLVLETSAHFGLSYARTLAEWRARFHARAPELEHLGFDARFRRLWDYYLSYCEAGFRTGATDVGLFTLRCPAE